MALAASKEGLGCWPGQIRIAANGIPLEAMLENPAMGAYHGYPILDSDPLAEVVAERWLQA